MILGGGALDGARVLAEQTVALMSGNAMGDLRCRNLKSAVPGSTNDVDFLDGMQWGLSFVINPEPLPTGRSAGSLAWAGLANSYYWIDPVKQVAGVYGRNCCHSTTLRRSRCSERSRARCMTWRDDGHPFPRCSRDR